MISTMRYCESPFFYQRRQTREIVIGDPQNGGVIIGGNHPVVKQSMLTCDTMDTELSVKQTLELVAVGCQLVRITAPTVKDAANLENIVRELRQRGCLVQTDEEEISVPGRAVQVVDTVGAGDAFTAGLLVYALEGHELADAAVFANRLAAKVAASAGGTPGIDRSELEGKR